MQLWKAFSQIALPVPMSRKVSKVSVLSAQNACFLEIEGPFRDPPPKDTPRPPN